MADNLRLNGPLVSNRRDILAAGYTAATATLLLLPLQPCTSAPTRTQAGRTASFREFRGGGGYSRDSPIPKTILTNVR